MHVGQAGNQIGHEFWQLMMDESPIKEDIFFDRFTNHARAVLVDSEPKVIKNIQEDKKINFIFEAKQMHCSQNGRGNNWALGYSNTYKEAIEALQSTNDKPLYERAMEALRREVERSDFFLGMVLVHSLAGGTGSGLGSRLVEEYRDTFGKSYLMSASIWPNSSGETPLQHYNTCFSLSHLQKNSDAVLLFQNEQILKVLHKLVAIKKEETITMTNLNESIVSVLKQVLMPSQGEKFDFSDVMSMACVPVYKILEGHTNPFIMNKQLMCVGDKLWNGVLDGCISQIPTYDSQASSVKGDPNKDKYKQSSSTIKQKDRISSSVGILSNDKGQSSQIQEQNKQFEQWFDKEIASQNNGSEMNHANQLPHQTIFSTGYFKGFDASNEISRTQTTFKHYKDKLTHKFKSVAWNPSSESTTVRVIDESPFKSYEALRSCTILGNRTSVSVPIRKLLDTSLQKYNAKAYLHWYYQYGMEQQDFLEAFDLVTDVLDAYESALY
ncbi:cryptic tubulin [Stylonychia lemnae]|uniref:Tubulin delta chain n=1 Tax=Stylonychia lemnae TaxID=5949 RepID=A0A078AZT2_STYLE|nr:cryptic tubulin [Stylonychia lemnae]|eukprot:CDW86702.1 cryptic tubulin [Stylonychia lemnae]